YMGDLDEALVLPRRADPRIRVPPGSVAIATTTTAIYPLESPGGWHLIGTTPIRIFDAQARQPALFAPGDAVEFEAVDAETFAKIRSATERHEHQPVSTELAA
ncbi:MAG: carboxyltransferase domain-containing protein, partial [Stellaceae bacterium]